MKIFIFVFLMSFSSFAVEIQFIGPCDENFIAKTTVEDEFPNVGAATMAMLSKFNIPFQGTSEGLASAFQTPVGDAAIEVVSADEKRFYGWCFSVDGASPDVYPDQISLSEVKEIVWTFGFARFYQGQWVTQCTPAWTVHPKFLCDDLPPPEQ